MSTRLRGFEMAVLLLGLVLLPRIAASQSVSGDRGIIRLRYAAIVVPDYDEALRWYTNVLGLEKTEDGTFDCTSPTCTASGGKRWLVVAPRGQKDFGIVLEIGAPISAHDSIHDYKARIGTETRWVFQVDDCRQFYERVSKRGVKFVENPVDQPWGVTEAMFEDLYGNVFVVQSVRPKG